MGSGEILVLKKTHVETTYRDIFGIIENPSTLEYFACRQPSSLSADYVIRQTQNGISVWRKQIIAARLKFIKSLPSETPRKDKTIHGNGFCVGWVDEIEKTVHAFANSAQVQEMIDIKHKQFSSCETAKASSTYSVMGLRAGQEAAKGEYLHRPVHEANKTLLKGN